MLVLCIVYCIQSYVGIVFLSYILIQYIEATCALHLHWYCVLVLHFDVACGADVYRNKGQPYHTCCVPARYKNHNKDMIHVKYFMMEVIMMIAML